MLIFVGLPEKNKQKTRLKDWNLSINYQNITHRLFSVSCFNLIEAVINSVPRQIQLRHYLLERKGLSVFVKINFMDNLTQILEDVPGLPGPAEQPTGAL